MLKVIADSGDREPWLKARGASVGASEAWKLVCEPREPGQDLRKELLMEKSGLADSFEETEAMAIGRRQEKWVFEDIAAQHLQGYGATWFGVMLGDPECLALSATPDVVIWNHPDAPGTPIPFDVKHGGIAWAPRKKEAFEALEALGIERRYGTLKELQADEAAWSLVCEHVSVIPEYVQVQLQVQCAVLSAPFAMTGRQQLGSGLLQQRVYTVQRHDGLIARLREEATKLMAEVAQLKGER